MIAGRAMRQRFASGGPAVGQQRMFQRWQSRIVIQHIARFQAGAQRTLA